MEDETVSIRIDDDEEIDVPLVSIARAISDEYVARGSDDGTVEQGYLAALSAETLADDGYTVEESLIEYFNNATYFSAEQRETIVEALNR